MGSTEHTSTFLEDLWNMILMRPYQLYSDTIIKQSTVKSSLHIRKGHIGFIVVHCEAWKLICDKPNNFGWWWGGGVIHPTLKIRGHIGLGLSVRYACTRSRTVRDRILKFCVWDEYEN